MEKSTIKWGIMGAGMISRKFASDLTHSPNGEIVAVASKTADKASAFAEDFQIPRSYGNYAEFVRDRDVDIIYIGTLHPMHKDCALACLRAGKAVLCEKPLAMDAREAMEMIQTARDHGTFLMEAMWTRYLPPILQARKWIEEGVIGEIKTVTANFGFHVGDDPNGRWLDKKLGGGALLDVGIYPISLASMIFQKQPERIMSSAYMGKTNVDERFSALLEYENGGTASVNAAVQLVLSNDAFIYGTEGYIHVPNFPFSHSAILYQSGAMTENYADDRSVHGYLFEAEEAMKCLRDGRTESSIMPLNESYEIMQTLDTLRKQWGLEYSETIAE